MIPPSQTTKILLPPDPRRDFDLRQGLEMQSHSIQGAFAAKEMAGMNQAS